MRKQVLGAALVKFGAVFFSYAANYMLVLSMSQAMFGRFSLMMAFASIATVFVSLGHPQIVLRSVASQTATGAYQALGTVWRISQAWILGTSGIFLLGVGVWWLYSGDRTGATQMFLVAFILPIWALLKLHGAVLHGANLTTIAQGAETVFRPFFFFVTVFIANAMFWGGLSTSQALFLNLVAFALAYGSTVFLNIRLGAFRLIRADDRNSNPNTDWFLASVSFSMISAMQLLILNIDTLMIGRMLTDEDVAVYRIAILLAMMIGSVNEVVGVVIRPQIAAAHVKGVLPNILPKMRHMALYGSLLCAMAFVAFAFIGRPALKTILGQEYVTSYTSTLILIAGQMVSSFFGPVGIALNMTRHEKAHFQVTLLALAVNIGLNLVLIRLCGIVGAATASLITIVIWRLAAITKFTKLTGVNYFTVQSAKK